jgi:hypothetical protein
MKGGERPGRFDPRRAQVLEVVRPTGENFGIPFRVKGFKSNLLGLKELLCHITPSAESGNKKNHERGPVADTSQQKTTGKSAARGHISVQPKIRDRPQAHPYKAKPHPHRYQWESCR